MKDGFQESQKCGMNRLRWALTLDDGQGCETAGSLMESIAEYILDMFILLGRMIVILISLGFSSRVSKFVSRNSSSASDCIR